MSTHQLKRSLQLVTIALIGIVSLVPIVSKVLPIPPTFIHGMSTTYELPRWSLKSFRSDRFQKGTEMWALRGHPLWSWSVRLANQLVYAWTGEISLNYGTSIQGGKEGYLWQPMYLRAFNKSLPPPRKKIAAAFKDLKKAQEILAQYNLPLIAVINPNILALYPELLPEKYQLPQDNESSYSFALEQIEKTGANVIDAYALLKDSQGNFPFRFFEPTGSHWNDIGSCIAARAVSETLAKAWSEDPPVLRCEQYEIISPPRPAELDLVEIANLLTPEKLYRPAPYVTEHPKAVLKKPRRILLVGSSFLFALEKQLLKHQIAEHTELLFYFRSSRANGTGSFHPLDRSKITREILLSFDAIVVDAGVAGPGAMGFGFLRFIRQLFEPPPPPQENRALKDLGASRNKTTN